MTLSKWFKIPGYFKASLIIIGIISFYCLIVFLLMIRVNKKGRVKSRFLKLNILLVKRFNAFIKSNIGKHWKFVAPPVLTLGIYLGFANLSGLFGFKIPTTNTSITIALAIYSICIVHATGILSRKFKHIKTLFEPFPFMFPINLIGDITPVISLSLRLFGNISAGVLMLGLIYGMFGWMGPLITPALHLIFDVGFGLIQMFVFVMLTVIFSSSKLETGDVDPKELEDERKEKENNKRIKLLKKEEKRMKKLNKMKGE